MQQTLIPLDRIIPSPTNPRKNFEQAALEELAQSIRDLGVLQPMVVRLVGGDRFEIVAGERRFRAAKIAGLTEVPAVVRELSDLEVLEVQVIENLHRSDLHPLEEAESYRILHEEHHHSVDDIAARLGKSRAYVYGRLKLCGLVDEAKKAFLEDRIMAGHAIILARLKPQDQERAIAIDERGRSPLFDREDVLWDPESGQPAVRLKTRSVAELQSWVDRNVRLEREETDPIVFPETAAALEQAESEDAKVLPITYEHQVRPEARGTGRTWGPQSWRRADGEFDSKTCEHSVRGMVVVGPRRGEVFDVCTAKKTCKVHWAREIKEAARKAKAGKADPDAGKDRWKIEQEKREAARKKEEAEQERWRKAVPALAEAVAKRVQELPVAVDGALAKIVLASIEHRFGGHKDHVALVPLGDDVDSLLRRAAFLVLLSELSNSWQAPRSFPKRARSIDIDVRKILNEAAPVKREAKKKGPDGAAAASSSSTKGKSPKRKARGKESA